MSRPEEYLAIPEEYGRWLGGVRWSPDREAVEYAADEPSIGLTFAMAAEIGRFLEGFHAVRKPVAFAYVLHLLQGLYGTGRRIRTPRRTDPEWERLSRAFDATGRPLRNAGYLCGALCRDVPRVPDPPDLADLGVALLGRFGGDRPPTATAAIEPSLEPEEFDLRVARMLAWLNDDTLRHWMEYGRAPLDDGGERVAEEVEARPKSLIDRLDEAARRPRLAASGALVPILDGALTLPPRRLEPAALPVGGYSDVSTRGHPEQILPSQFALDDLEFLRRFAARELLYFHREEPRSAEVEELVLVLDQGVRTWGDVRLILSAAALALARRAARRGMPLRLATTGRGGEPVPADDLGAAAIGDMLESSDLSADPGSALERALESRSDGPRDVLLLTHPRSLVSDDVAAAARRVAGVTRLFAVAVDASGQVDLAELRHGSPVSLARCRVTIPAATSPLGPPDTAISPAAPWRGEVEPIGYPFRLGAVHPIPEDRFAFDGASEWLLAAAGPLGLLLAWKLDGSAMEILPRPICGGGALEAIDAVVGVTGGFVVAGRQGADLVAAHYDFGSRICQVHRAASAGGRSPVTWHYSPRRQTVGAWEGPEGRFVTAFFLDIHPRSPTPLATPAGLDGETFAGGQGLASSRDPAVRLDPKTGTVEARTAIGDWAAFTPTRDGRPEFLGARVVQAKASATVLGLLVASEGRTRAIHFYAGPGGRSLGSVLVGSDESGFALGTDGRLFARRIGPRVLQVRAVGDSGPPRFVTGRARVHSQLTARLGASCLMLQVGNHLHMLSWNIERLATFYTDDAARGTAGFRPAQSRTVPVAVLDRVRYSLGASGRFLGTTTSGGLTVVTDVLGHAIVLDARAETVAIFHVFRHELAGWLPDGTAFGPVALIGGPSTAEAHARIAAALRRAEGPRQPIKPVNRVQSWLRGLPG